MKNKKNIIKFLLISLVVVFISIFPAYKLFSGILNWHIKQPEVIQGGIELLVFVLLSFIASIFDKSDNKVSIFILFLLYLSTNGVIIPAIATYFYVETLSFIGFSFYKNILKRQNENASTNFIIGINVWGSIAIIMSLLKLGTFNYLRALAIILLLIAVFINRKYKYKLLITRLATYINRVDKSKFSKLIIIIFIYLIACSFAKSNNAIEYDSMWYGLRPEFVLIGKNSFYDYLGLSSFVFYYPKLFEFVALPISNLGDYSFIYGFNIIIIAFTFYQTYKFFEFSNIKDEKSKLLLSLVICSVPAILGIGTTAKPDIFGYYLVLCALYYFCKCIKDKNINYLFFSVVVLMMCTGTKETYILWGGGGDYYFL